MRPVAYVRLLGLIAAGLSGESHLEAQAPLSPQTRLLESYGRLPLHFEGNEGQIDHRVKFLARGSGYSLFLTPTEAVLALSDRGASGPAVLRLKLAGANSRPHVTGRDELPGKVNYFVGNDSATWRTNIATYARVQYRGVYPGIDLVYYGNQRQLEYDFVVAPGADPGRIRMSFDGARDIRIDAGGDLILHVAGGDLRQHKPVVYQDVQGIRQPIAGRYVMKERRHVGFELGAYDETRPLVIDPILVYSTYLGGAFTDQGNDIAVDRAGNAYVTGQTNSAALATPGAYDPTFNSLAGTNTDAFVAKLDVSGSRVVYFTYLGGSAADSGNGIAVDAEGNAYVVGSTGVTTASNFPTTTGAFDTTRSGQDAFVTKLNPTGSALVYSTYLGAAGTDLGTGIAVDVAGNAYVTGQTFASIPENGFPATPGAVQPVFGGAGDAFVTKLNLRGTGLVYSTYVGGSGLEIGNGIGLDAAGHAYVTGETRSTNFPATAGALDTSLDGESDAFVAKLDVAASSFVYSTYLGGTDTDFGRDVAVDAFFNASVTGRTSSGDFPTTPRAFQAVYGGEGDAFVTTVSARGGGLLASTYLGGSAADHGTGIAVDTLGSVFLTGVTSSGNFPVTPDAVYSTFGGVADAFVTTLNTSASALIGSAYLGGRAVDSGNAIALDLAGNAYVTGSTGSINFPTTAGAFDTSFNGSLDAFIAKIEYARVPAVVTLDPTEATSPVNSEHCVTATVTDAVGNPVPGVTVRFRVTGAANTRGSRTTDENGKAVFCYTGPVTPGADAVYAFADPDENGVEDIGEPGDGAAKVWVAGPPATLTLTPATATNPAAGQHCFTAAVKDAFDNATPGITVQFQVTGTTSASGSAETDTNGQGRFCYTGPTSPGVDAIWAFADTDEDGTHGAGEPGGAATKTWVPGLPATLTLTPATATNPVAGQHCVTATVTDMHNYATPGIIVRFQVTGATSASGSAQTDANGQGRFCYTGPTTPGADGISAFADADEDGTQGAGEPGGAATKTWMPGPPATLTLTPAAATNPVGALHCVTATVRDAFNNATPGITVRFNVTGAVNTSGSAPTDVTGQGMFCYTGPTTPGADRISAFADTDEDGTQGAGDPGGAATKTWVPGLPATLALTPAAATSPVGTQHCVAATVKDAFDNATPDITVRFNVTGAVNTSGSAPTDVTGQGRFCYTGPTTPGADGISAFADTDEDGTQGAGEPGRGARNAWVPGLPATLALTPAAATSLVGTQHCVTATVNDAFNNATPGITVRFNVTGATSATGSAGTGVTGQGRFCYTGPTTPGADGISAFADTDEDGTQGAGEPGGAATKTWVPGAAAALTLTPAAATSPVRTQHCVTATVKDAFDNATPGITVRFNVTGAVNTSGSAPTDVTGQGAFCYTGPTTPGADGISAFADRDENGAQGAGEPGGATTKTWVPGAAAALTLTPPAATSPVGTQHCVTATVTDAFGNATFGTMVRFYVTGGVTASGSATTDAGGEGDFCYAGPTLPGADTVTAYVDSDNDGGHDAGEPTGVAVKTWLPASAAECKVTGGGYITTVTGGRAIFSGHAWSEDGITGGKQEYHDRGREPRMRISSLNVLGVVCRSATEATIFGQALVNGSIRVDYRIEVKDMGEPGHGRDTYSIILSDGYSSGEQILKGGNIQIH